MIYPYIITYTDNMPVVTVYVDSSYKQKPAGGDGGSGYVPGNIKFREFTKKVKGKNVVVHEPYIVPKTHN